MKLSIVYPDEFLLRPEVCKAIRQAGRDVVVGNSLELRVHYELNLRNKPDASCIYIVSGTDEVLPDITINAQTFKFDVASLFPNFSDKATISKLSLSALSALYNKHIPGRVNAQQLNQLLKEIGPKNICSEPSNSLDYGEPKRRLENIVPDWQSVETIKRISEIFIETVKAGRYDEIAQTLDGINYGFQHYLDETYFSAINSNPLFSPKCVNGVMPFIKSQSDEKIALVVVDGMAFWQYMVLRRKLAECHISPFKENWIYAWIPSITCLSRQALFYGAVPLANYKQSPQDEQQLWKAQWTSTPYTAKYFYGTNCLTLSRNIKRVAFVTTELDEKMHSSSSYRDLLALTEIWAETFSYHIQKLRAAGFTIYLTTDHGNVEATGYRRFTPTERAHLYANGSRGRRHAIFQNGDAARQFQKDINYEILMKQHDFWFACRANDSFDTPGVTGITHGGTHLFEVMIPFIKF
jgi:hypothetical protein